MSFFYDRKTMTSVRTFLAVALLAYAVAAHCQLPELVPAPAQPMSQEDLRAVYGELAQTHDGLVYTYHLLGYPSEEAARDVWEKMQQPRFRFQRFDKLFKNVTPRTAYLFAMDPVLREKIVSLYAGERTGPLRNARGWVIAELLSTRPAPVPAFAEAEPRIPGLILGGTLPGAAELKAVAAFRNRTIANGIQSVDDLRAAPADLDVNMKLSSQDRLLLRSVSRGRLDLQDALLKRGANPNLCARKFCPLQVAIFQGSPDSVDLLLKAGADPNQVDPAIGVAEGPLGAAAFRGNIDLAGRLIAAGAKVGGVGKGESPLMAAASAANRPMVEFLLSKGADPSYVTESAPARGVLDSAERSKNAEFASWLRGLMLDKAKASGRFSWTGWIEQDGKRFALDGKPVVLKRAPFGVVARMKPEAILYVSAGTDVRQFEEFRKADRESAMLSSGNISAESKEPNGIVVHEPRKSGERWGGSEAWWKDEKDSRFTSVKDTPQGREHTRRIERVVVIGVEEKDGKDKFTDATIADYGGKSIFLVIGTRLRMTFMDDAVVEPREVELTFGQ